MIFLEDIGILLSSLDEVGIPLSSMVDVGLLNLVCSLEKVGLQSLVTKLGDKGLPLHLAYLRFGGRGQED